MVFIVTKYEPMGMTNMANVKAKSLRITSLLGKRGKGGLMLAQFVSLSWNIYSGPCLSCALLILVIWYLFIPESSLSGTEVGVKGETGIVNRQSEK